jgi:tail sheath stabilizer
MFAHSFYFSSIRKYVSLFGTLFSDIVIDRAGVPFSANTADDEAFSPTANATYVTETIRVPITYGPRDKMIVRVIEDPKLDRPTAITTLPLMSFEITGVQYDGSRKLVTAGRIAVQDPSSNSNLLYQYNPVPYNISFKLSIFVKNVEDGAKIVEHILPFFTPEWTTTCIMIPELNAREDVTVVLHGINCQDSYDGEFKKRMAIVWDLDFTLKGKFYGPIKRGPIIQFIDMPIYAVDYVANSLSSNSVSELTAYDATVQVVPGLTANGLPTSNAAASVNVNMISVNTDYGFVTSVNEYDI